MPSASARPWSHSPSGRGASETAHIVTTPHSASPSPWRRWTTRRARSCHRCCGAGWDGRPIALVVRPIRTGQSDARRPTESGAQAHSRESLTRIRTGSNKLLMLSFPPFSLLGRACCQSTLIKVTVPVILVVNKERLKTSECWSVAHFLLGQVSEQYKFIIIILYTHMHTHTQTHTMKTNNAAPPTVKADLL